MAGFRWCVSLPWYRRAEIINVRHWLGALVTSMNTIGIKDTPMRRIIHRAADWCARPVICMALVLKGSLLHGMYSAAEDAWSAAADRSAQLISFRCRGFQARPLDAGADLRRPLDRGQGMYKTEPVVADGGEVVIFAPHLTEVRTPMAR